MQKLQQLCRNLLFVLSALALAASMFILICILAGLRPFILRTSSMEPLYKEGSLVLAQTRINTDQVSIGDVLIYRSDEGSLIMHRLVDQNTFKGDANQLSEHVPLSNSNLVGKEIVSFYIPGFGDLIENLLNFPWILWCLFISLIILSCIPWKGALSQYRLKKTQCQKNPNQQVL